MSPLSIRSARAGIAACLAGVLLTLPSAATAATSKYPPEAAARGFDGGLAGWSGSSSFDGSCAAPLLCPTATNSFEESGGADDGGFIRSAYFGVAGVMAVAGTTTAVWQSPTFTYEGVDGKPAATVDFGLDRRASVDQLLAVEGNSADYTVRLVDVGEGGESVMLIGPATLAGASTWTRFMRRTPLDPDLLTIGHRYRVQITTRYTTGASALVSGSADYDDVVLAATKGGTGGSAGAAISSDRLAQLLRQAGPRTATLRGKRLFVRLRCPRKARHACRTTAQGLLRKRRPATAKRTVRLRSGKSRLVALRIKRSARGQLEKRKRLLIRQKVRAGKATATVAFRVRRLIRR